MFIASEKRGGVNVNGGREKRGRREGDKYIHTSLIGPLTNPFQKILHVSIYKQKFAARGLPYKQPAARSCLSGIFGVLPNWEDEKAISIWPTNMHSFERYHALEVQ